MEVRKLDGKEHWKTRNLYEEVFAEDSAAFVEYYYTEKVKDNEIYVVEEDGEICAMLHLNPYTLCVNGRNKSAHYIVAVATKEKYRKRGYMKTLMIQALRDLHEKGETFTYLMPAAEALYTPFDFRTVYEQENRYCPESDSLEEGVETSELEEQECKELAETANEYLKKKYQIFAWRDAAYYERLKKECESDQAKLMLYRKNEKIVDLRVSGHAEEKEAPKIMARILDVRRMLMSVNLRSLMAVAFHITDPILEENNRCVVITGTEFSGVMLMDSKPENSEGSVTIGALTSLLLGAKNVEEICEEDGVKMTERMKQELKKIIPLSQIYLNEIV